MYVCLWHVCVTARAEKVKRGVRMLGIIFPHTGSPALRQMENGKGEQGEIQLSQVFCSSSVLIAVCVCVCVRLCFLCLSGPLHKQCSL